MLNTNRVILGIDPGTATIGFAIITGTMQTPVAVDYGVITTQPVAREYFADRLMLIANDLEDIINKYQPTKAVIEEIFFFKNHKTAIYVAEARGVMLYLFKKYNIEILEKTPLEVKQIICGYGMANKKQVQTMVTKRFRLESTPKPDDAADALAIAFAGL
jgi:crossover junction endodeoxyribonuclease RuvC